MTINYLFEPVKKRPFSANCYKSIIYVQVPEKGSSKQQERKNGNALLSRIKIHRELGVHFSDECIGCGTLCVSRYHQIRKIFMSDNTSVYKDHVFPYKYKTIPDGIMILQGNKDVFKKFYKSY